LANPTKDTISGCSDGFGRHPHLFGYFPRRKPIHSGPPKSLKGPLFKFLPEDLKDLPEKELFFRKLRFGGLEKREGFGGIPRGRGPENRGRIAPAQRGGRTLRSREGRKPTFCAPLGHGNSIFAPEMVRNAISYNLIEPSPELPPLEQTDGLGNFQKHGLKQVFGIMRRDSGPPEMVIYYRSPNPIQPVPSRWLLPLHPQKQRGRNRNFPLLVGPMVARAHSPIPRDL
jgi:hypothetical protein